MINDPYGNSTNIDAFEHHGYGNNVLENEGQLPNFTEMFAVTASNRGAANGYAVSSNAGVSEQAISSMLRLVFRA